MMGLDITAYGQVKRIGEASDWEDYEEHYDWKTTDYIWPGHVADDAPFGDWSAGIAAGVYEYDEDKRHSFRAGSYSGYNEWRAWLSVLALGVAPSDVWAESSIYEDKPFYRLINFSDCEGIIGPVYAKQLAKDFAAFQSKADAAECNDWFKAKYTDWRKAFELAADGGYVDFH